METIVQNNLYKIWVQEKLGLCGVHHRNQMIHRIRVDFYSDIVRNQGEADYLLKFRDDQAL